MRRWIPALGLAAAVATAEAFSAPALGGLRPSIGQRAIGRAPTLRVRAGRALNMNTATLGGSGRFPDSAPSTKRLTPANAAEMLDQVDVFIFDCDGVIWKGDTLIDGVPAILDKLRAAGKKCFFVTNNSTKSRKGYKGKFDSLGLNVQPEEIFSSSFAAAAYLEQIRFRDTGKKVYILGERGIQEELDLIGVPWIGGEGDATKTITLTTGYALPHDHNVGAVIVGFDRFINYYKIQYAQLCINENPGCQFIATNLDAVTHLTDAQEWAGNGAMTGAIKGCTGQEPVVVGKPSPLMIDYLADKYGVQRNRVCMVGDRLDTDVVFGNSNGALSCLVYSGVTTEAKYMSPDNQIKANYYCNSIADFFEPGYGAGAPPAAAWSAPPAAAWSPPAAAASSGRPPQDAGDVPYDASWGGTPKAHTKDPTPVSAENNSLGKKGAIATGESFEEYMKKRAAQGK